MRVESDRPIASLVADGPLPLAVRVELDGHSYDLGDLLDRLPSQVQSTMSTITLAHPADNDAG